MSALRLGAVEALERMLKNPDWRAKSAAVDHILRVHGKYVERYDISGQLNHSGRIQHDHQGRFTTGEILPGEMSDEMRTKARELLAEVRKMRAPRALLPRLTDPSSPTNGHRPDDDDTA